MFEATTQKIKVTVTPSYIADESDPHQSHYFFAYQVQIANEGKVPVQLLSRHWIIKDGYGHMEEVVGEGVIGQQPRLEPGQEFTYSSFCPLSTPTGSMEGTYTMRSDSGEQWQITIPRFLLCEPSHYN